MERKHYYTDERNAQIVIALLKAHGIRRLVWDGSRFIGGLV